ncbi:MAG: YbhB/YbcL family Raf kinase inhibitor-like protein [Pseudomonadota bacterium]
MNTKTLLARISALTCAAVLAGCAAPVPPPPPPMTSPVFTLWSPTFPDGASLTTAHAGNLAANPNCVGQNVSPPLAWANLPVGTKSLAMLVHDQEGRSGLGVAHWVAYGISPALTGFAENEISVLSNKYVGGKSTLNLGNYMGPCPPAGTGQHHYVYTVIATDAEPSEIPAGLTMQELLTRLQGRAKGASSIVLRYGRP